jgi:hypothetical protein
MRDLDEGQDVDYSDMSRIEQYYSTEGPRHQKVREKLEYRIYYNVKTFYSRPFKFVCASGPIL